MSETRICRHRKDGSGLPITETKPSDIRGDFQFENVIDPSCMECNYDVQCAQAAHKDETIQSLRAKIRAALQPISTEFATYTASEIPAYLDEFAETLAILAYEFVVKAEAN